MITNFLSSLLSSSSLKSPSGPSLSSAAADSAAMRPDPDIARDENTAAATVISTAKIRSKVKD